ncbi:hypothetical protein [Bacillus sp. AK128]
MRVIRGKVVKGVNERSQWMKELESDYSSKTGIKLFPVTIQIQLMEPASDGFPPYLRCDRVRQVNHSNTCFVNGIKVFYLEASENKSPLKDKSQSIIEIVTDRDLIESLELGYGDEVVVEIPILKDVLLH